LCHFTQLSKSKLKLFYSNSPKNSYHPASIGFDLTTFHFNNANDVQQVHENFFLFDKTMMSECESIHVTHRLNIIVVLYTLARFAFVCLLRNTLNCAVVKKKVFHELNGIHPHFSFIRSFIVYSPRCCSVFSSVELLSYGCFRAREKKSVESENSVC
jgi:hypothetical protein